ncbi:MAG: type IV pilus modification PilV family protein [Solirubrobacterales bacterium]
MAMIEILVSALLLVIVALGVFTAFDAGTRASAQERHRARAHALAEADVARMQAMRIGNLAGLDQTRNVTHDGLTYSIRSQAIFVDEPATTSTCATGSGSRDYLQVRSTVTWASIGTRPPVTIASIVSPPNGSIVPDSGALMVHVEDSRGDGIAGVALSGTGAGSFNGSTGATGCVLWRNLPVGNYTLSAGGAAAGKVDTEGNPPAPQTASVVAQSTNTVNLQYDSPGSVANVGFRTRDYAGALVTSTADSMVVDNTGMSVARVFSAPGGVRATSLTTTTTLFPFTSPYSLYAGNCGSNNPSGGGALGSATVPVGGTGALAAPGYIQLPSLLVTVYTGTNTASPRAVGAKVTVRDPGCNVTRTLTPATGTDANGRVPTAIVDGQTTMPTGLPYGSYDVCAVNSTAPGGGTDRRLITNVAVQSVGSTGTALNVFLGGQPSGTCP